MCFKPSKKYSTGCTQWARKKRMLAEKHLNPKYRICFSKKKHFSGCAHHIADPDQSRMKSSGNIFFRPGKSRWFQNMGSDCIWYVEHDAKGSGSQFFCGKTESFRILLDPDQFQFRFLGSAAAQEDTNNQCRVRHDD